MEHNRSTYANKKCRCDVCKKANSDSGTERYRMLAARVNIPHKHEWRKNGKSKGIQRVVCRFCAVSANERDVCQNQRLKH